MITKHQILALRDAAEDEGRYKLVYCCNRALAGDQLAIDAVAFSIDIDTIYTSDLTTGVWVS